MFANKKQFREIFNDFMAPRLNDQSIDSFAKTSTAAYQLNTIDPAKDYQNSDLLLETLVVDAESPNNL